MPEVEFMEELKTSAVKGSQKLVHEQEQESPGRDTSAPCYPNYQLLSCKAPKIFPVLHIFYT